MTLLPLIYNSEKKIVLDRFHLTSLRAAVFNRATKYYETTKRLEYDLKVAAKLYNI